MSSIASLGNPTPKTHTCSIAIPFHAAIGSMGFILDSVRCGSSRCYTLKNSSFKSWRPAWVGRRVGKLTCGASAPMANIAAKVPEQLLAFSLGRIAEVDAPSLRAGVLAGKSLPLECARCSLPMVSLIFLIFFATAEVVFTCRPSMSPYIAHPVGFFLL